MRIGQKSKTINIINLISAESIEMGILATNEMKTELFDAVFDGTSDEVIMSSDKKEKFLNKIRRLLKIEQKLEKPERRTSEELPVDLPNYLNPEVLNESENIIEVGEDPAITEKEENSEEIEGIIYNNTNDISDKPNIQSMETVLENGLSFLSGLMAIATGKPLVTDNDSKMINVNKETGEVIIKFKLPV